MFSEKLEYAIRESGGNVCVGLDPHRDLIPKKFGSSASGIRDFLGWIIDETIGHMPLGDGACLKRPHPLTIGEKGGGPLWVEFLLGLHKVEWGKRSCVCPHQMGSGDADKGYGYE